MFDVLAIGELNPDLIVSGLSAAGPRLGTEQTFERQTLTLGSSTAIACVLMQRLGLRTAMAALVGDDEHGRFCRDVLAGEGVAVEGIRVHPTLPTGITLSLSYPADRMLLTRYGTMAAFGGRDVDPGLVVGARHLHAGSWFLQSGFRADLPGLFAAAQARGQTTSLDLGWDPTETWDATLLAEVLPHVSVVFPNRAELAAVTRTEGVDEGIAALHAAGARAVAVKVGGAGAVYSGTDGVCRHPGYAVEVVDTTGAGDAFNAGFVRGMLDGAGPRHCLAQANACGALTTQGLGGTGGLHSLEAVRTLMGARI